MRALAAQGAFGKVAHYTEHVSSADFNRDGNAGCTDASDRLPARSESSGFAIGDGFPDIAIGTQAKVRGTSSGSAVRRDRDDSSTPKRTCRTASIRCGRALIGTTAKAISET
ncbi:MAG: hypothetical protein SXG53_13130 [Pseudomonadota bacterium]|nr:hypothetical protein [Pseudomonadota bacterium]